MGDAPQTALFKMVLAVVAVVIFLLRKFVGVEQYCAFRDDEFSIVMFLFFDLDFAGAIWINFETIAFWSNLMRESCFS